MPENPDSSLQKFVVLIKHTMKKGHARCTVFCRPVFHTKVVGITEKFVNNDFQVCSQNCDANKKKLNPKLAKRLKVIKKFAFRSITVKGVPNSPQSVAQATHLLPVFQSLQFENAIVINQQIMLNITYSWPQWT